MLDAASLLRPDQISFKWPVIVLVVVSLGFVLVSGFVGYLFGQEQHRQAQIAVQCDR